MAPAELPQSNHLHFRIAKSKNRHGNVVHKSAGTESVEAAASEPAATSITKQQNAHLVMGDPRTQASFIDRHTSTRTVPLQVLCLGLGRTGTNSLRHALFTLGYHDVYHYSSLFENPPDLDMWLEALHAKYGAAARPYSSGRAWHTLRPDHVTTDPGVWGRPQWDRLLGHCMAVSDNPALHFVPELLAAYPEAKVVVTTREPRAWHRSYMATIYAWQYRRHIPRAAMVALRRWLSNPGWPLYERSMLDKVDDVICRNAPIVEFPEDGVRWYHEHNEMVKRLARGREVLEFDVREGWGPLCAFLGKEVPCGIEFPRVNDTEDFKQLARRQARAEDVVACRNVAILLIVGICAVWLYISS